MTRQEMEARRLEIAELLKIGVDQAQIARDAGVTRTSVCRIARQLREGRNLSRTITTGRPMELSLERRKFLMNLYRETGPWTNRLTQQITSSEIGVNFSRDHSMRIRWGIEQAIREGKEDFRPMYRKPK